MKKIEVDHFIPCGDNKDLKFDWNNLFFSCGHCNNTKLAKYDNILNCTLDAEIETKIKYWMNPYPKEIVELTALEQNEVVNSTIELLQKIYNGQTHTKINEANNLKEKILGEIVSFQDQLLKYYNDRYSDIKEEIKKDIARYLKKDSTFASFKRWIIRSNPKLMEDFGEFID